MKCPIAPLGNDAILTPQQQEHLVAWLDAAVRSTKEAITWVETTFQVRYTESGMRKLLQRME